MSTNLSTSCSTLDPAPYEWPLAGRAIQRRHAGSESVEREEADVVASHAVDREVGEDLADDRCELVAVARLAGEERDLRRVGQGPSRKCSSGEFVNMHALSITVGPAPSGK